MTAVWAWVEDDVEVMGDAADLAERVRLPALAFAAGADPRRLALAGAERVFAWKQPYAAERAAAALLDCLSDPPLAVLFPSSANGSDLAPRVAAKLGAACLMDCAEVSPGPDGLEVLRWAFDDRVQERWQVPGDVPLVATMRTGRGAALPRPRPLNVVEHFPSPRAGEGRGGRDETSGTRRRRRLPADPGSVRLSEARRIVAAGLGIGSRDALPELEELAALLGAAIGASRPLADRGWVDFERQVGVTGQVVSPDLYVAVGVSGAVQHTAGIRQAETVVAVNVDPSCPMMVRADLAVVGDAAEVVPALLRALRDRKP